MVRVEENGKVGEESLLRSRACSPSRAGLALRGGGLAAGSRALPGVCLVGLWEMSWAGMGSHGGDAGRLWEWELCLQLVGALGVRCGYEALYRGWRLW